MVVGLPQVVGHCTGPEPPLAPESPVLGLDLGAGLAIDHLGAIGAQPIVQFHFMDACASRFCAWVRCSVGLERSARCRQRPFAGLCRRRRSRGPGPAFGREQIVQLGHRMYRNIALAHGTVPLGVRDAVVGLFPDWRLRFFQISTTCATPPERVHNHRLWQLPLFSFAACICFWLCSTEARGAPVVNRNTPLPNHEGRPAGPHRIVVWFSDAGLL